MWPQWSRFQEIVMCLIEENSACTPLVEKGKHIFNNHSMNHMIKKTLDLRALETLKAVEFSFTTETFVRIQGSVAWS